MRVDRRVVVTATLYERLQELVNLRKRRGFNTNIANVGQEILSDFIEYYIRREEAIASGSGPQMNFPSSSHPSSVSSVNHVSSTPVQSSDKRSKFKMFLNA